MLDGCIFLGYGQKIFNCMNGVGEMTSGGSIKGRLMENSFSP